MKSKFEQQVKVLEYCKEQGIPIGEPIANGEHWIYPIDMKNVTSEQYKHITKKLDEE